MPASGFRVPVPVTSRRTGAGTGGKFEIFAVIAVSMHFTYFLPTALSGALPAF
ncbi:unnamed protein product [Staurois parvus]|uniref:Uncharacterized protein n=1 Tax=Staurois parvus TaxID=386267 RepID=A0ABN9CD52_9NEOB|nr:unnamed protein product [Staurois parvus]